MMELPKTPPRAYSAPYREPKMPLYNRTGIYSALLGLGGLGGGILDERGR